VYVATPNATHLEYVEAAAAQGKAVLCEKPLEATLDRARRLVAACREADAPLMVGYRMQTDPAVRRLRELIEAGVAGDVIHVHATMSQTMLGELDGEEDQWRLDPELSGGGALMDLGVYPLNTTRFALGADPVRVSAFGNQHVFGRNTDIIDQGTVSIEYEDTIASLDLCLYAGFGEQGHLAEYRGSEGVLRTPGEDETIEQFSKGEHNQFGISADGSHKGGDIAEMRRFLRCLRGEAEPPADVRDAKKADVIAFAAKRSLDEGRMVDIDSNYDMVDPST